MLMPINNRFCAIAALMPLLAALGCGSPYPGFKTTTDCVQPPRPSLPVSDGDAYAWRADTGLMSTYFGKYDVEINATQKITAETPGAYDAVWSARATTRDGIGIGYLGVLSEFVNENGTRLKEIVPSFDLSQASDGLYVCIDNGFKYDGDGRLTSIEPVAHILEIRSRTVRAFDFPVRLIPIEPTDLTPLPARTHTSRGTPIGIGQ